MVIITKFFKTSLTYYLANPIKFTAVNFNVDLAELTFIIVFY